MLTLTLIGALAWFSFLYLIRNTWKPTYTPKGFSRGGGGGQTTTSSHTYYYYKVKAAHNSLDPSQSILCYDAFGTLIYTIPPYDSNTDYGAGIYSVPGSEQNTTVESISTATYYVFYSNGDLVIDYENAEFKIAKRLIRAPAQTVVKATFEYLSVITAFKDIASVIDGRWDTQVQTEFFAEPPNNYNYAILDLGSIKTVQALDIIAGFYKPDDVRKYDVNFNMTLQYSLNGTDFYDISDETDNFAMSGGESKSFEEQDLGIGFQARYFKLLLENVKRIDYGQVKDANGTVLREGVYVIALTEIAAYDNIILKSEATLIPTTQLTTEIDIDILDSASYPSTIYVEDTSTFDDVESGDTYKVAYIIDADGLYDQFTYTDKTSTSFIGVQRLSISHEVGDYIVQEYESDTTIHDYRQTRHKLGDRLYKMSKIDDNMLFTQTQLDYVAKKYLEEFVKNHTKIQVDVLFAPHLEVGQTIKVNDPFSGINRNYFIESIKNNNGFYSLILAYYP